MKKDKNLQNNRTENIFGNDREEKLKYRSLAISGVVGCFICLIFVIIESSVFNRNTSHLWLIYNGMLFSRVLIDAITSKKKKDIVVSIILGLCCVGLLVYYIIDNFG